MASRVTNPVTMFPAPGDIPSNKEEASSLAVTNVMEFLSLFIGAKGQCIFLSPKGSQNCIGLKFNLELLREIQDSELIAANMNDFISSAHNDRKC